MCCWTYFIYMSEENCGDSNRRALWGIRPKMLILWSLLLTAVVAHKVVDSTEDIGPEAFTNVTTLYPIKNDTNVTDLRDTTKDSLTVTTELRDPKKDSLKDATVWKIDATFAQPDENNNKENGTESAKNETKDFRPSQHLESYIEVDAGPTASTYDSFTPMKKPAAAFVSIPGPSKDEYRTFNKLPKDIHQTHKEYPYKFDSSIYTRTKTWSDRPESLRPGDSKTTWFNKPEYQRPNSDSKSAWSNRPESLRTGDKSNWYLRPGDLESRPTVEAPIRVPAGGLYKYQDPFKEKPGGDEDFGLEFGEGEKENHLKKRGNPFQDLIRLMTAFIPVGLIISALTPSLITIEDTGPGYQYPSNVFRRSDPGHSDDPNALGPRDSSRGVTNPGSDLSSLPVISERCRRRLLCELHSDNNYVNRSTHRVGRHCYKIRCEEPEALARSLRWLLEYRQTHHGHT